MSVVRLLSQRVVLHRAVVSPFRVYFDEVLDEPGIAREFMLTLLDYEDMGEPEAITVTIEPGDRLNDVAK